MRATRSPSLPLLFLLLFILPIIPAHGDGGRVGPAPPEEAWEIDDHQVCREESWVIDTNITVHAGAMLELAGCQLLMDSFAYADEWFASADEGLTIFVEPGGTLWMHPSGGRASSIGRNTTQYGYTIKVEGLLRMEGEPGLPNNVSGLEGFMAEGNIGGGLQVSGTGYVNHTEFYDNVGPSLFVARGGSIEAQDVTVK